MFFTRLGRILAILILIFGIFSIAMGLAIANDLLGPYDQVMSRYFPTTKSSGTFIDRGLYAITFAIVLGVLTEIRYALRT